MSAAQRIARGRGRYGIIPALFMLAPLLSCIMLRAPALLPILGLVPIIGALRQGLSWRQLLLVPSAALAARPIFTPRSARWSSPGLVSA